MEKNKKYHVFSIDVEDWYQGIELPFQEWSKYEKRVEYSMNKMLEIMAVNNVKSTCFILGKLAEEHPQLVKDIYKAGHEIATHGYSHEKIYNLSPKSFQYQLHRSICYLEDLIGEKVIGHRAPYFSITKKSLWALDILSEEGILYDSSIHPVINYRYGISEANRLSSIIKTTNGVELLEVPVSTYAINKLNIPVGGGAYLRIYPYFFLKACLKALEKRNEIIGIYIHPWEIDYKQPKIKLPFRVSATHYFNLSSTERKVNSLLSDFKFAPYRIAYKEIIEKIKQ